MKNTSPINTSLFIILLLFSFGFANAKTNSTNFTTSPLHIVDTCFMGGPSGTSFGEYSNIAGIDGDLMEWNGSGWTGSWPNADLTIPPIDNNTCRAVFIGASSGWTTGGEGFGLRLNSPLVAGQNYVFYFTYVSHGTASTGDFNPTLFTGSNGTNISSAFTVDQLPPAGTDWETNSISFTANGLQDGHDWIILHTLTTSGSGIVAAYCCGEINSLCAAFEGSVLTTDADCLQGGTATASVSGNCSLPSYSWSNGSTGSSISNLNPGAYSVTILDNCCETIESFIIDITGNIPLADLGPDLSICEGNVLTLDAENNGSTYLWSTGETSQDIQVNSPGTYSVTITNASGCTNEDEVEIGLTELALTFIPSNPTCDPSSGLIDLEVDNGQAPYTYIWSTGAQTQDVANLSSGWYFVTTTDVNNCFAVDSVLISDLVLPDAQLNTVDNLCPDAQNGAIDVSVSIGTAPFTYNWSTGASTEDISNLAPGDYDLIITDANNCTNSFSASISGPPSFSYNLSGVDACGDLAQAYININSGGNAPYTYLWSNGGTTDLITGLTGGTYSVTVSDATNCTFIAGTTVNTFDAVLLDWEEDHVSCFGYTDGTIDISVIQGLSPFSYEWANGPTTEDINNLADGEYTIFVTDANSCVTAVTIEIMEPDPISLDVSTTSPVTGNDGSITIEPVGGTPPFSASWSNNDTGLTADSLSIGMYEVLVTDAAGCTYSQTINLNLTSITDDEGLSKFDVYPNPNDGHFNIDLAFAKTETAALRIFDVLGRELFMEPVFGKEVQVQIDLERLSVGVYFVVLELSGEWRSRRVVVK